jgi:hypothetical protein
VNSIVCGCRRLTSAVPRGSTRLGDRTACRVLVITARHNIRYLLAALAKNGAFWHDKADAQNVNARGPLRPRFNQR